MMDDAAQRSEISWRGKRLIYEEGWSRLDLNRRDNGPSAWKLNHRYLSDRSDGSERFVCRFNYLTQYMPR